VLARHPEILRAAFAEAATGVVSELQPLGEDGYFVFRVDEITQSEPRPLSEVEDQVRAQFSLARRSEALDALAETARASLAGGAAPSDAAAAAAPVARGEISSVRRDQATPTLSREFLARAFAAAVGDVVIGAAADGGRVLARIDSVGPASDLPADATESARLALSAEILQDVDLLYQQGLLNAYARRDDRNLMAQALGVDSLQ
jgi:peptidyl-prolyl cis-trans isomerase D